MALPASATRLQLGRGLRTQRRLFNMAEALGGRSPAPPGSPAPGQAATPVQADLDAPTASPARALGAEERARAGSSSSLSPRVRPTFPFSSYTPGLGKTDRGAVHSLRGALIPLPHRGVAALRASLGPPLPSRTPPPRPTSAPSRGGKAAVPSPALLNPGLPAEPWRWRCSRGGPLESHRHWR